MRHPASVIDAISARRTARIVANLPRPGAYRAFVPKIDDKLVVSFPGESIRVPVKKIVNEDTVLIHLDTVPMSKSHRFEFDRVYGVRRRIKDGRDVWEAQYERDFLAEQDKMMRPVSVKKKVEPVVFETGTLTGEQKAHADKMLAASFKETKTAAKPKAAPKAKVKTPAKKAAKPVVKTMRGRR